MAVEPTEVGVFTFGDRARLECYPPEVNRLVSKVVLDSLFQFPGASDEFPAMFYLRSGGQICSYLRVIPDEVTVDGHTYRWAWTGDNFTFPEFRRRGLSTELQAQATAYLHAHDIGRGSVFSTDVTLHIYRKLGFTLPGYAKRYLVLRSATPLLNAHVKNPYLRRLGIGVSRPLATVLARGLKLWNWALLGGTSCSPVCSSNTDAWEHLVTTLTDCPRVHFGMHAGLIRHKLGIAHGRGQASLWLIQSNTGRPLAYVIIRKSLQEEPLADRYAGFRLMTLMDFACADGDAEAANAITGHTIRIFLDSDCDVLEIISSNPLVHRAASHRGMVAIGKGMSFNYHVPESWSWPSRLREIHNWPLTRFCGDAFTF